MMPLKIKTMEAHHPHHVTQKKKWTEYLPEFILFKTNII